MSIARLRFQADELEKVVNTDALTGAYNRFYFDRSLATYDVNDETFDPGSQESERTLAACLTHASRTRKLFGSE